MHRTPRSRSRFRTPLAVMACAAASLILAGPVEAQVKAKLPRPISMPKSGLPLDRGPVWGTTPAPSAPAPGFTGGDRGRHIDGHRGDRRDHHGHPDQGQRDRGRDHFHDRHGRGQGTSISGSFHDDHFGLKFRIGQDPALLLHKHHDKHGHDRHHKDRKIIFVPTYFGYPHLFDPFSRYGYGFRYSRPLYSQIDGIYTQRVEPEPAAPEAAPEPPTDAEIGAYQLRRDDAQDAILSLRTHLADNPDDTKAMRGLAVALLMDARFTEGHAMMSMAYREDPALADEPIDPTLYFGSERDFERAMRRCTIQANRAKLSGAYLTVVVLLQAEGNYEAALRVLEKARDEGLEVEVADALERALGG